VIDLHLMFTKAELTAKERQRDNTNFSQVQLSPLDDGSHTIRNMSE